MKNKCIEKSITDFCDNVPKNIYVGGIFEIQPLVQIYSQAPYRRPSRDIPSTDEDSKICRFIYYAMKTKTKRNNNINNNKKLFFYSISFDELEKSYLNSLLAEVLHGSISMDRMRLISSR